jgi:hypothetical protein
VNSLNKNNIFFSKNKITLIFLVFFIIIIFLIPISFAQISAVKYLEKDSYSIGEDIIINLEIKNDYNSSVIVTIKDSNLIDGSGLEINCLEKQIFSKEKVLLSYNSFGDIIATESGNYTITPAIISYINQDNQEIEIETNFLDIEIIGVDSYPTKIKTEVYQCGGLRSISTQRFSSGMSGSSFTFQTGGNHFGGGILSPNNQDITFDYERELWNILSEKEEFRKIYLPLVNDGMLLENISFHKLDNDSSEINLNNGDFSFSLFFNKYQMYNGKEEIISIKEIKGVISDGLIEEINVYNHDGKIFFSRIKNLIFSFFYYSIFIFLFLIIISMIIIIGLILFFPSLDVRGYFFKRKIVKKIFPKHFSKIKKYNIKKSIIDDDNLNLSNELTLENFKESKLDKLLTKDIDFNDFDSIQDYSKNIAKEIIKDKEIISNRKILLKLKEINHDTYHLFKELFTICEKVQYAKDYSEDDLTKSVNILKDIKKRLLNEKNND